MQKLYLILILFICLIPQIFPAKLDSLIYKGKYFAVIDSVEIRGNKITENDIILRELTFEKGDTVSNYTVEYRQGKNL